MLVVERRNVKWPLSGFDDDEWLRRDHKSSFSLFSFPALPAALSSPRESRPFTCTHIHTLTALFAFSACQASLRLPPLPERTHKKLPARQKNFPCAPPKTKTKKTLGSTLSPCNSQKLASTDAAVAPGGEAWKAQLQLPPKDTRIRTEVRGKKGERMEKEKNDFMPSRAEQSETMHAGEEKKGGSQGDSSLPSNLVVLDAGVRSTLELGAQQLEGMEKKASSSAARRRRAAFALLFFSLSRRLFFFSGWRGERQSGDGRVTRALSL